MVAGISDSDFALDNIYFELTNRWLSTAPKNWIQIAMIRKRRGVLPSSVQKSLRRGS